MQQASPQVLIRLFGAIALALLVGCSSRVDLFSAITDAEANEILAVLLQSAIPAEKQIKKNGVTLSVAESDVAKALGILRLQGLPRERFEGMGKIFQKEGMISSPLEERARYIYALSQELESTLTKMDGVLVARVHVVLPDQDAAKISRTPASAAVFIKHQSGYNLEVLKPQIRTLVSHAIPELGEDRVSVVLVMAQRTPASSGLSLPTPTPIAQPTSLPALLPTTPGAWQGGRPQGTQASWIWWLAGVLAIACAVGVVAVRAWRKRRDGFVHDSLLDKGAGVGRFGQG
ncbi:EscJ/YscJ/HrcJ family type III secretion inner membrane ring protein [Bordetella genomosp. 8]|uniref:Lipoprotein n=1 Tax=Bordetella genomosp. 8 TaxID=1416806 RepID=A0A1W6YUB7_9BORD|nr:type III secretion inner membrane ring lipoprotein SctJ [Bordetella genomosp. 8]ARP84685.1 EscJ/YscJ/HrcJ family type III secretion inner membrane ring protein [Bordetella genomosp. 8]